MKSVLAEHVFKWKKTLGGFLTPDGLFFSEESLPPWDEDMDFALDLIEKVKENKNIDVSFYCFGDVTLVVEKGHKTLSIKHGLEFSDLPLEICKAVSKLYE